MADQQANKCPEKTEVYSRVVGFFRPVQQWNKGKQEEFRQRRVFQPPIEGSHGQK